MFKNPKVFQPRQIFNKNLQCHFHHLEERRKSTISKCWLLSLERIGANTRPPNENKRSAAALAGNPVFNSMYNFLIFGYFLREDKHDDGSARYFSTSSELPRQISVCRRVLNAEKNHEFEVFDSKLAVRYDEYHFFDRSISLANEPSPFSLTFLPTSPTWCANMMHWQNTIHDIVNYPTI